MWDLVSSSSSLRTCVRRVDWVGARRRRCWAGKVAPFACALSTWLRMSCEDFLGGLPLLVSSAGPDVGGNGPVCGDDGFGFFGRDGFAVVVTDDVGHATVHHGPGPVGQVAATTQTAPRWSLPRSTIWVQ